MKRKTKRTFRRDEQVGFRVPSALKGKLEEHARNNFRDMSDLCIQYVRDGLIRDGAMRATEYHPGQMAGA